MKYGKKAVFYGRKFVSVCHEIAKFLKQTFMLYGKKPGIKLYGSHVSV